MRVRSKYESDSIPLSCRIFGHKITNYKGEIPYLRPEPRWAVKDNMNVLHVPVYARCKNCNSDILVAKIHERNGL